LTYRHAISYALKRLSHQRFLALHLTIGLLAAVALATAQLFEDQARNYM